MFLTDGNIFCAYILRAGISAFHGVNSVSWIELTVGCHAPRNERRATGPGQVVRVVVNKELIAVAVPIELSGNRVLESDKFINMRFC
jgi:hypothetical protein